MCVIFAKTVFKLKKNKFFFIFNGTFFCVTGNMVGMLHYRLIEAISYNNNRIIRNGSFCVSTDVKLTINCAYTK